MTYLDDVEEDGNEYQNVQSEELCAKTPDIIYEEPTAHEQNHKCITPNYTTPSPYLDHEEQQSYTPPLPSPEKTHPIHQYPNDFYRPQHVKYVQEDAPFSNGPTLPYINYVNNLEKYIFGDYLKSNSIQGIF